MRRREFSGGQYADALPDGRFAVQLPGGFQTHTDWVAFPSAGGVLHHRVGLVDGVFCIAGQGHQDGQAWLWNGTRWLALGPSYGTSVAAFGPLGVYVSSPSSIENIRIFNREGWQVGAITSLVGARGIASITGSGTGPIDVHAIDNWYGAGGLAEYTLVDGFLIGQGADDGLVIKYDDGQPALLEPGHVEFCRASSENGHVFVASAWKVIERKAVICWFDRRDLLLLPRVPVDAPEGPEKPEEPAVSIPDLSHVVRDVNDVHPHLLIENSRDSIRMFYWRAAWALQKVDSKFGMLSKAEGENHQVIGGQRVSVDAVGYEGSDQCVDIIASATDGTPTRPTWGVSARRPHNVRIDVPPPPSESNGGGTPDPPKSTGGVVVPTQAEFAVLLGRLEAAEAKAEAAERAAREALARPVAAGLHYGDRFVLTLPNGRVLCAEGGGTESNDETIRFTSRDAVGSWEVFALENPDGD